MGAGLAKKCLFLILILVLSLAGIPRALECFQNGKQCPGGPSDCCSGLCEAGSGGGICVACLNPGEQGCNEDANCCSGMQCRSGVCNSCTCEGKAVCGIPNSCSADSDCCSGICSGTTCVACIASGKDCLAAPDACCNGLSCTNGVCSTLSPGGTSGNWYDDVYLWTGLAVVMAAAFLGLAYMASKLLELQVLEAWVKIELGELVKSMVIAVFCVALIASVNAASGFLVGEQGATNVIAAAQGSLEMLYNDAHSLYMKLAVAYFHTAKTASYSYMAGTSAAGYFTISYSAAPGSGMSPLVMELGQALDAVANYMMLAASQAAFLQFFGTAAAVMLPVGIFLRSFSFTRRLGGTLLAATIGAAVIYPASLLLAGEVYQTFQPALQANIENVAVAEAGSPPLSSVVCNEFMKQFIQSPIPLIGGENGWWIIVCIPVCAILAAVDPTGSTFATCFFQTCKQVVNLVFMIIKSLFPILLWATVFSTMDAGIKPDKLMEDYYQPILDYALPTVAQFAVISLVTFLIPIIITLSLLRALSLSFGGEAQLYGLSRLV